MSKLEWNLKPNVKVWIEENAFENVICGKAAILSQPQFVTSSLNVLTEPDNLAWCGLLWSDVLYYEYHKNKKQYEPTL